ncbi:MAG: hypothetical protein A2827_01555 [Candidatus Spechtbacteria bacterium RIFCSPHIGHO2_01_FULL_43_30]|uniref:Uncharacterized protein n=1 Tax=Candidatus Spechtbacteria bacterium RIFCSPHIGHO2_01_FULL_43_30 TaxID=1802158 RepID=A0A1G2H7P5_9BACT|nr:MAG: hypothetical protein A2827_01555 [Candidatus Spechtbacteria bacterium RIFCSPHIGHO2_01_FULL_43_30]
MLEKLAKFSKYLQKGKGGMEFLRKNSEKFDNKAGIAERIKDSNSSASIQNSPRSGMDKFEMWDKIGRVCVYLLFGAVPVFFLPFTSFPVVENKTALGGLLVLTGLGLWFVKILNTGKISLPKTKIWLLAALFLLITAVSTIKSESSETSIWGHLSSPDSFSHLALYLAAMLLVPLFLRGTEHLIKALLFFSVSLFLISIFSLLQLFGIFTLPFDFSRNTAFNPIGNPQGLAIFLGSGLVMLVALLASFKVTRLMKAIFSIAALLLGVILMLIDFSYIWIGLFLCSVLLVSWQVMNSRRDTEHTEAPLLKGGYGGEENGAVTLRPKFGLPVALMIVVAIMFFAKPPISSIVNVPPEVRPSLPATLGVASASMKSDFSKVLLGSGPSTFLYEYLSYRPQELNATAFWNTRFSQGFSTISTMLVNLGILGTGSLLTLMAAFSMSAFKGITALSLKKEPSSGKKSVKSSEKIALISFASFLFLILFWFAYPVNFSVYLLTFLFMGVVLSALTAGGAMKTFEFSYIKSPQHTFAGSAIAIVMVVFVIVGGYWHIQKYVASAFHTFGVNTYNGEKNVDAAIEKVQTAVKLDSDRDDYWRTLSELLNLKARAIINSGSISSPDAQRRYQVALQNLIQSAQEVTRLNPLDPLNWSQLASVYELNIDIVRGSERFAIKNYKEALDRNPKNPQDYLNLARAYVLASDGLQKGSADPDEGKSPAEQRKEYLESARDNLQEAITLKNDYAAAHFMISQVYERLGERALAIQKNADARNLNPLDTGVGYQLGLLFYINGELENAKLELERVVRINPDFSNALYFLGLSYEKLGNTEAAIKSFTKIRELNPANKEVEKILENLRAARPALFGISSSEDFPEERLEAPIDTEGTGPDVGGIE